MELIHKLFRVIDAINMDLKSWFVMLNRKIVFSVLFPFFVY